MERITFRRLCGLMVMAVSLTLNACGSDRASTASAKAVPATAQPETIVGEEYAEAEATIQSIDTRSRNVTLRTADGETQAIEAPADVDLTRLKKGDVVIVGAYQRLSVMALPAGSAPLGMMREAGMAKSVPGATPGRAVAEVTRVISEVAAIDLANNTVTLRAADGRLRTLDVKHPDNQRKLKTLKVGDLVQIEFAEVVAVRLKPKA